MFQKFKDVLLCAGLGFATMIFLTSSMLGGNNSDFFGIVVPIIIALVVCGAWLKQPRYIHFVNLAAFLAPIVNILSDMKMGVLSVIVGVGAFLIGCGLRFLFTVISFYLSSKKES
jgi:hypothetical protein